MLLFPPKFCTATFPPFVHKKITKKKKKTKKKNRERSSSGCTSAHSWAEKVKSKAKFWLAMHGHTKAKPVWNDLY